MNDLQTISRTELEERIAVADAAAARALDDLEEAKARVAQTNDALRHLLYERTRRLDAFTASFERARASTNVKGY